MHAATLLLHQADFHEGTSCDDSTIWLPETQLLSLMSCVMQVVTLLLHQANVPEALKQFQQHMGAFKKMPLPPPPAAASAHGAWVLRQYTVMGELLSSRVEAGLLPQQVTCIPLALWVCVRRNPDVEELLCASSPVSCWLQKE